jgi:hypothetical protein
MTLSDFRAIIEGLYYRFLQWYCERFGHVWYAKKYRYSYDRPYRCARCGMNTYDAQKVRHK